MEKTWPTKYYLYYYYATGGDDTDTGSSDNLGAVLYTSTPPTLPPFPARRQTTSEYIQLYPFSNGPFYMIEGIVLSGEHLRGPGHWRLKSPTWLYSCVLYHTQGAAAMPSSQDHIDSCVSSPRRIVYRVSYIVVTRRRGGLKPRAKKAMLILAFFFFVAANELCSWLGYRTGAS